MICEFNVSMNQHGKKGNFVLILFVRFCPAFSGTRVS
jgi:hypothetical protein